MKFAKTLTAAIAVAGLAAPALADENGGVEIGTLECAQTDRTNLIVWSEATYVCKLSSETSMDEMYVGEINKIGIDLTIDKIERMAWTVVAPTDDDMPGSLSGTYVGVSADASLGAGLGARALVGGGDSSFALQPLSLKGEEGVGIAAGIESFNLELMKN